MPAKAKKRIIICADGTWNRPEKDIESDFPTNVLKCARGIKPIPKNGPQQIVFYDWGVGSDRKKVSGGIFGNGINKNIKDCYRFIVQNYSPGDELFLFGFSRGAYTVRSLAGLLNNCGILRREHANRVHSAYEFYKHRSKKPGSKAAEKYRAKYAYGKRGAVKFIGVWDTVGALGVPLPFLKGLNRRHQFHDCELGSNISHARQALAIDEKRKDFWPAIWEPRDSVNLEQVWFTGAHADVGGSTKPDKGGALLSDVPFQWILQQAAECGLSLERHVVDAMHPNAVARYHNSRTGIWRVRGKKERVIPVDHPVSSTVKRRQDAMRSYKPKTLMDYLAVNKWTKMITVKKPKLIA